MVTVVVARWKDESEGPLVGWLSSRFGVLTASTQHKSHSTGRKKKRSEDFHTVFTTEAHLHNVWETRFGLIRFGNAFIVFQWVIQRLQLQTLTCFHNTWHCKVVFHHLTFSITDNTVSSCQSQINLKRLLKKEKRSYVIKLQDKAVGCKIKSILSSKFVLHTCLSCMFSISTEKLSA